MQFVVIGAGNMGCVYGANLARIGQDVAFLDVWEDHVAHINSHGLFVTGLTGDFRVPVNAYTNAGELPKADVALICVNAYSTSDAAQSALTALKENGICVTLQNGVGNVEVLIDVLGRPRVLPALSFQSGDLVGPGNVRHTNNGPTYLGELSKKETSRLLDLERLFAAAGMNPVIVDDIIATIWAKFVHNCGINAICAITGLRPGQIHEVPDLDCFQTAIIKETVALLGAKGIAVLEQDPVAAVKEYCSHKFHRPSMMQHLARGQKTEIDSLNGYVASESVRLGLSAPYNAALTSLIKGREHRPATDSIPE